MRWVRFSRTLGDPRVLQELGSSGIEGNCVSVCTQTVFNVINRTHRVGNFLQNLWYEVPWRVNSQQKVGAHECHEVVGVSHAGHDDVKHGDHHHVNDDGGRACNVDVSADELKSK